MTNKIDNAVFYTPANGSVVPQIIDFAKKNDQGILVGLYCRETLEQIEARHPGAQLGSCEEISAMREAMLKSDPVEIDEDQFQYMLEVLPPEDWQRESQGESFKMSEYTSGRITGIYARVGKKYFMLSDIGTLPHKVIMAKCIAARDIALERQG